MLRCWRVTPARRTLSCSQYRYGRCSQMMVVKHHPSAYLQPPADKVPRSHQAGRADEIACAFTGRPGWGLASGLACFVKGLQLLR